MSNTLKNILSVLAIVIVAAIGWYLYSERDSTVLNLGGSTIVPADVLAGTQVFIERGAQLKALNLETSIFTDERFRSLQSYSTPVPEIPTGRTNPFLPAERTN